MVHPLHHRFWVLLISAAVAFAGWKWVPGSVPDRLALEAVVRGFANPPLLIAGRGTHENPWSLRTLSSFALPAAADAPLVVSLGDDPEGFFQSSPPSPIDLAVMLTNIQRLGAKKAATAAVLAWDEPDPISLAALERSLEGFEGLVTAAPLSRAAVPSPIPPQFRRASLPLTAAVGDYTALPVVNRLPIPGVILGGDRALAGFTLLENEESPDRLPLLARWDDRIVFSFPLLAVLLRHDLPIEGISVKLGENIRLGRDGLVVPIDAYGRLSYPLKPSAAFKVVPAELLIDGGEELFPEAAPDPVILRDDQSAADAATRDFSRKLSAAITAIASEAGLSDSRSFRRLSANWELGLLGGWVLLLAVVSGPRVFSRNIAFLVLAAFLIIAQLVALGLADHWLPGIPGLAAVITAAVMAMLRKPNPLAQAEVADGNPR